MKQILLRVPDDVHRRLALRAARAKRSVNALATEILDAAIDADEEDRRTRLRAQAAASGLLRAAPGRVVSVPKRRRVIASTKGTGAVLDRFLADERERV